MALDQNSLSQRITQALKASGFKQGEHSQFTTLADAIAKAVVDEIQANAQVVVAGGSSSGSYKVS